MSKSVSILQRYDANDQRTDNLRDGFHFHLYTDDIYMCGILHTNAIGDFLTIRIFHSYFCCIFAF